MSNSDHDYEDHLPLTPAVFHILLALTDSEKHGYAIMREVEQVTEGRSSMGPGTLYGAIKRLLNAGLIVETKERPDPALDNSLRRYYELTDFGRKILAAEAQRLSHLVQIAREKKLIGDASTGGLVP
ncbi:MAG: PadR family transcriptional regulator [Anaerolineales bacterium]|jgi:DNA-binding PadR family transcriptional regulator